MNLSCLPKGGTGSHENAQVTKGECVAKENHNKAKMEP